MARGRGGGGFRRGRRSSGPTKSSTTQQQQQTKAPLAAAAAASNLITKLKADAGQLKASTEPTTANKRKRTNSQTSKKGNTQNQSQKSNSTSTVKSISQALNNPQNSIANNVLIPVVPPLYPPAGTPGKLHEHLNSLVPNYLDMTRYFKCNYSIPEPKSIYPSPFRIERYSDRYLEPLSMDPTLLHRPDPRRLPRELIPRGVPGQTTPANKPFIDLNVLKKLEEYSRSNPTAADLGSDKPKTEPLSNDPPMDELFSNPLSNEPLDPIPLEEEDYEIEEVDLVSDEDEPKAKVLATATSPVKRESKMDVDLEDKQGDEGDKLPLEEEEEEDELDEELDAGTDYACNFFDNGEDYLEDEDDSIDDAGAVY